MKLILEKGGGKKGGSASDRNKGAFLNMNEAHNTVVSHHSQ